MAYADLQDCVFVTMVILSEMTENVEEKIRVWYFCAGIKKPLRLTRTTQFYALRDDFIFSARQNAAAPHFEAADAAPRRKNKIEARKIESSAWAWELLNLLNMLHRVSLGAFKYVA